MENFLGLKIFWGGIFFGVEIFLGWNFLGVDIFLGWNFFGVGNFLEWKFFEVSFLGLDILEVDISSYIFTTDGVSDCVHSSMKNQGCGSISYVY